MARRIPRSPTGRSVAAARPDRRRWRRPAVLAALGVTAVLASGCVGQRSRNDDVVGPYSPRPDNREHTLGPPVPAAAGQPA